MQYRPVEVLGEEYATDNRHWSAQHMVNRLPVPAERAGTRTAWQAPQAPGLKPLVHIYRNIGGTIEESGPVRGGREVEGKLFVVAGTTLWQITPDYVCIPLGTIPGISRVSMSHNQRGLANEVMINTGSSGYIYNTGTMTLTRITDDAFPGGSTGFFIEGFFGVVEPQGRFWGNSERGNGLSWNSLSRYEAPGQPDKIITGIESFREALIFGARTVEFYVNRTTQDGNAPFERASNTSMAVGCSAKFSVVAMDNSVFWLDDKRIVRRKDGYSPIRISTQAIEQALAECTAEQIAAAFAFVWEDKGHKVYYLTVPGKFTFGYDVLSQRWHRRLTKGMERWRLADLWFWNGKWVGGDYQSGRLYELDWKYSLDGQDTDGNPLPLVRRTASGFLHNNQNRIRLNSLQFIVRGDGEETIPVDFPVQPEGPAISGDAQYGVVGQAYTFTYTVTGGEPPYRVQLRTGVLPAGVALSQAGVLSGTPTTPGNYSFTIRVTDSNGLFADLTDSVAVTMPMILMAKAGVNDIIIPGVGDLIWNSAPISTGGNIKRYGIGVPGGRYATHNVASATPGAFNDTGGSGAWTPTGADVISGGRDAIWLDGALIVPGRSGVNRAQRSTDRGANFVAISGTSLIYLDTADEGGLTGAGMSSLQFATTVDAGANFVDQVAHGLLLSSGGVLGHNATKYVLGGEVAGIGVLKDWDSVVGLTTPVLPGGVGAGPFSAHAWDKGEIEIAASGTNQILRRVNGGAWVLTAKTFTHPVLKIKWSGANFLAVTSPTAGGPGELWGSPDGITWTLLPLAAAYPLSWIAQAYA